MPKKCSDISICPGTLRSLQGCLYCFCLRNGYSPCVTHATTGTMHIWTQPWMLFYNDSTVPTPASLTDTALVLFMTKW